MEGQFAQLSAVVINKLAASFAVVKCCTLFHVWRGVSADSFEFPVNVSYLMIRRQSSSQPTSTTSKTTCANVYTRRSLSADFTHVQSLLCSVTDDTRQQHALTQQTSAINTGDFREV